MSQVPPIPFGSMDFSGGLTDNIYSNDSTKCQANDNLVVDTNKTIMVRPGSELYAMNAAQLPSGSSRVGRLFKFIDESFLFARNQAHLYYFDQENQAWTELTGPSGNAAYGAGDDTASVSYSEWLGHMFTLDNAGGAPIKIYQDQNQVLQVRTAGMPAISANDNFDTATATASLLALANSIRTQFLSHFNNSNPPYTSGLPHITADTVSAALVGSAATDLASTITLTNQLTAAYLSHTYDAVHGLNYHLPNGSYAIGNTSADFPNSLLTLSSVDTITDIYGIATRLNELLLRYNYHESTLSPHSVNATGFTGTVNLAQITAQPVSGVNKGPVCNLNWQPFYDWAKVACTRYEAHTQDGGTVNTAHGAKDNINNIATTAVSTPQDLMTRIDTLSLEYLSHNADAELSSAWSFHIAQNSTPHTERVYAYYGTVGAYQYKPDISALIDFIHDFAPKFTAHAGDLTSHYTNNPTPFINLRSLSGSDYVLAQYAYAILYSYAYTVGDVAFEDDGPPYFFTADQQLSVDISPLSITGIPALSNSAITPTTNYDTSKITVKIYRTTNGGSVYYYAGSVTNGVTTFSDSTTDTQLVTNAQLYTTDGSVANDPPPVSKCIHIVNNIGYYGNIVDGGSTRKNRIRQSIPDDPDSVPGSFFDDIEDEVIGISSVRTLPIVFGKHSIYRLEGGFDAQGRGAITHVAIHNPDSVGLISENSLVKIETGICFAGSDGFYFTDGYQLLKLSRDFNATYASLLFNHSGGKRARIDGTYDKVLKQVHWTVQRSQSAIENDSLFTMNLNFGLENPIFSTASNSTHFQPTAICMVGDNLLRGDSRGFVFVHVAGLTEDPYINESLTDYTQWGTKAVIIDYKSCASDFGFPAVRKWASVLTASFQNTGNLSLDVYSENDSGSPQKLGPITSRGSVLWGDPTIVWGQPDIMLYFVGTITAKRKFPAHSMRFTYKQVEFTNRYMLLVASSTNPGTATVDSSAKTVTLDNTANVWASGLEGQFFLYAYDGYVASFEILQRNSDTVITVIDTANAIVSGSYAWQLWGYPKGEAFHMNSFAVHAIPLSTTQTPYRSATIGVS